MGAGPHECVPAQHNATQISLHARARMRSHLRLGELFAQLAHALLLARQRAALPRGCSQLRRQLALRGGQGIRLLR